MSAQFFEDPFNFQSYDGAWGSFGYGLEHPELSGNEGYGSKYMSSGNSLGERLTDALGITDYKGQYEEWKTQRDREYERQATNSARAWDLYMDSTKYQRAVQDLKEAGLNPWLALQSGLSGAAGSQTASSGSSARSVTSNKKESNLTGIAMLIAAVAKVIALI